MRQKIGAVVIKMGTVLGAPQPVKAKMYLPVPQRPAFDENEYRPLPIRRSVTSRPHRPRLSVYTANNPDLYNAAVNGFIAGAYTGKLIIDTDSAEYRGVSDQAAAYGQAIDQAIPAGSVSIAQTALIAQLSQGMMIDRWTTGLPSSAFTSLASAVYALYVATSAVHVAPGPTPPATPTAPIVVASSTYLILAPSVSTQYIIQSSAGTGGISVTIEGVPAPGVVLSFYDETQNWVTYNFTLTVQPGWTMRNPWNIAGVDANSVVFGQPPSDDINGQSFSILAVPVDTKWL